MINIFNLESIREIVKHGPEPRDELGRYLPGVNYIIRPDGRRMKVTVQNAEESSKRIEVGWTVERQLMEGDIVLFNRQPSLHRMSMMGHTVRILSNQNV